MPFDADELLTLWVLYDWFRISRRDTNTPVVLFRIIHGNTPHPAEQILDAIYDFGGSNPYQMQAEQRRANDRFVAMRAAAVTNDLDLPGGNSLSMPFPAAGVGAGMLQTAIQLRIPGVQGQNTQSLNTGQQMHQQRQEYVLPHPSRMQYQADELCRSDIFGDSGDEDEESGSDDELQSEGPDGDAKEGSQNSSDDPSSVDEPDPKPTKDKRISWNRKGRRFLYIITIRHAPKHRDWTHYVAVLKQICAYLAGTPNSRLATRATTLLSQLGHPEDVPRYAAWKRVVPQQDDTGRTRRHKVNELRRVREVIERVEAQLGLPVGGPPNPEGKDGGDDQLDLEELKGANRPRKRKGQDESEAAEDGPPHKAQSTGGATFIIDEHGNLGDWRVPGSSNDAEASRAQGDQQTTEQPGRGPGHPLRAEDAIPRGPAPHNLIDEDDDIDEDPEPALPRLYPELDHQAPILRTHELELSINGVLGDILSRDLATELLIRMFSNRVLVDADAWRSILVVSVTKQGAIDILEAVRAVRDSFGLRGVNISSIDTTFQVREAFEDVLSPLCTFYLYAHQFKKLLRTLHHSDVDWVSDPSGPVVNTTRPDGSRVTFFPTSHPVHKHKGKVYRVKLRNKGPGATGGWAQIHVWIDVMVCHFAVCGVCNPNGAGVPHPRPYGFVHREDLRDSSFYDMQWPREPRGKNDSAAAIIAVTFMDGFARYVYVCGKDCRRCKGQK